MLLELAAFEKREADPALKELAQLVRLELAGGSRVRARLGASGSLCEFIAWLDSEPPSSQYFTPRFWKAWRTELSGRVRAALSASGSDESAGPIASSYDVAELELQGGDWRPAGFLSPVDYEKEELTPGAAAAMALSERATRVPLAAWTEGSIHFWDDETIRSYVAVRLSKIRSCVQAGRPGDAHDHAARLLILASATPARAIPAIRWEQEGESLGYPGCLTRDARWLKRPELMPPEARRTPGTVWIPIPKPLRQVLLAMAAPVPGEPVLLWSPHPMDVRDDELRLHATALQRALLSRLAHDDDLGLTAAQWVAGDTLGVSTVPLHYDEYGVGALARKIQAVTHPWFGDHARLPASALPEGVLGTRFDVSAETVQGFYRMLRDRVRAAVSLPERISALSAYIAHGLAASAGHRPSQGFAALRLPQLCPDIAILTDKVVAPDWRCRPVAMAPSVWNDISGLVNLLREAAAGPPGALARGAASALSGSGPFLLVAERDDVRPFGVADFMAGMPTALAEVPNFARQLLNRALIGHVPEPLRVAQMGWHGTREGIWAEGSPVAAIDAARRLQRKLDAHLSSFGWIGAADRTTEKAPHADVHLHSWVAARKAEDKAFRGHVARLQKATTERHASVALAMRPRMAQWLAAFTPAVRLDDRGRLRRAELHGAAPAITAAELNRLERHLAGNERQTERRAVARNLLSVLMRDARRADAVQGPVPRRVTWRFPARPNGFSWVQPYASTVVDALARRLQASLGEGTPGGRPVAPALSYAAAYAGVALHGGYPHREVIRAVLAPTSTLHRSRSRPGVLLVNVGTGHQDAEQGHSYAFHGRAALLLSRWHLQASGAEPASKLDAQRSGLDDELAALFENLLPAVAPADELIELVRAERMLSMDGVARLVGSGQILPTGADARRVIADHEDRMPPKGPGLQWGPTLASGKRLRVEELDTLYRDLSAAAREIQDHRGLEPKVRAGLTGRLRARCGAAPASPAAADLVARYALALLERGGMRKRHLQLSTIRNYVLSVGRPLVEAFGESSLPASAAAWQRVFQRIVFQCAPERRQERADAIGTFLWVLNQEFDLPVARVELDVEFAERCLGDAGYATCAEIRLLHALMRRDIDVLQAASASLGETEDALASYAAVELMSATGERPGEVAGVRWKDVRTLPKGGTALLVRGSRYLSLKTPRARRRIRLRALAGFPLPEAVNRYRHYVRAQYADTIRPGASIWQLGRPRRLGRDGLFKRASLYLKHISGRADARPYWLRKAVVGRRLLQLMEDRRDGSLWALRTLLAEAGHASIRTTLGHYIHDPCAPFVRWFRALQPIDQRTASLLAGRGRHSGVRRGVGSRGSVDPIVANERVARLLGEITFEPIATVNEHDVPPAEASRRFVLSHAEMDRMLRAAAAHGSLQRALSERLWPGPIGDALQAAVDELSAQWGLNVLPVAGRSATFPPPRNLSEDGGMASFLSRRHSVLESMGRQWLQLATLPGLPDGVPGTTAQWECWEPALGELGQVHWIPREWGPYRCRVPTLEKSSTSLWPLFRWGLVVAILHHMVAPPAPR